MASNQTDLTGEWEGWTKVGGGSRYHVGNGVITLSYDITGTGYYGRRGSNNVSERPWTASVRGKVLRTNNDRYRVFGSKEAARKAAEKALKEIEEAG